MWDLTLPARHGSYAYLAGVLEAVIGARLNERDLAVPTDVTLAALGGDGALAQSFPTQFARTP